MIQKFLYTLVSLLVVSSCATLQPGYETPVVSISSFKAIPTDMIPQFEIGLHIVNPNRSPLELIGISYSIALEGHKIMTGVSNDLPLIEAYGEGEVTLIASIDLFNSIGFVADLFRSQVKEKISYSLAAKLDAGTLHPFIRITKEGELSLSQPAQNQ